MADLLQTFKDEQDALLGETTALAREAADLKALSPRVTIGHF